MQSRVQLEDSLLNGEQNRMDLMLVEEAIRLEHPYYAGTCKMDMEGAG